MMKGLGVGVYQDASSSCRKLEGLPWGLPVSWYAGNWKLAIATSSFRGELTAMVSKWLKERYSATFNTSARITGSTSGTGTTRWYLVGIRDDIQKLRVFGIDRILEIETTGKTFKPKRGFNPLDMFRHTIGINSTENKPELVELSFSPLQGKYVKGLPWHHSQKILVDNDEEMRIELYVNPNLEFKQRIMATGAAVKVLKPQWLADEIRNRLKASLERY